MNCTVCEVVNKVHFKKNVEPRLVSSFSNYVGGGPMPLAVPPHDLCMQLLACSSSQSVFAIALLLACHFCVEFFPILPPLYFWV